MSGEPSSKRQKALAGRNPRTQRLPRSPLAIVLGGAGRTGGASSSSNDNSEPSFAARAAANPRFYEPPPHYDASFFSSKKCFKTFVDHYRDGIVTIPTFLALDDMLDMGVTELIDFQGWRQGLSMHRTYSPLLIKMFYANMVIRSHREFRRASDFVVSTMVLGQTINVDLAMMNHILGAPNAGHFCYSDRGPVEEGNALHPDAQWEIVGGPQAPSNKPIALKYLDPLRLVLWHVVTKIILPRVGNLSEVKCVEVWVIANLIKKRKLNLGYLILSLMAKNKLPVGELKPHFPYAHIIMDILVDQGIVIPPTIEFLSQFHSFNKAHITCNLKVDIRSDGKVTYQGGQVSKKIYYAVRPSESDSDDDDDGDQIPLNDDSDEETDGDYSDEEDDMDLELLGEKMNNLEVHVQGVRSRVDEVYTRMDGFDSRMDSMQNQLTNMDNFQRMMYEDILRRLPPPPPQ